MSGRVWRTECVISHRPLGSFLRVRGQCVLNDVSAEVMMPKKPFFITQAIDDGWGGGDGEFDVSDSPYYLEESSIDLAGRIVAGEQKCLIPCVYISRGNDDSLPLDADVLARKLAGLAHVIVEPSRKFSFQLMEHSFRRNPYGGAIGIFLHGRGEMVRLYANGTQGAQTVRISEVISGVVELSSKRSAKNGLEWQTLQELQGRSLRQRVSENVSEDLSSYIDEFDKEVVAKDERIRNLEELVELANSTTEVVLRSSSDLLPVELSDALGPQLYDGEFSDRLRLFLQRCSQEKADGVDERTQILICKILEKSSYTGRAVSLVSQIKSAGKDGNQMSNSLGSILSGFGYSKTTDGKHIKFEPPGNLFGLPTEILPSTPSDSQRGGKNKSQDIIRNMGLNYFK
ncbi:hypothetical protein [Pararhodobacter sp.]|uniref:hypothetical protein n=1 Tax=Pararhodobacter sp. TaxID=2127056 RepID=UPI002AFEAE15|nr:hypothetical protein [Pararhodobacter sp.]